MNPPSNKQQGARPVSPVEGQASTPQQTKATPPATEPSAKPSASPRKPMPLWVRIPLRIMRILLVPFLCVAALIGGVVIGYVYMGGRDSADVWDIETWKHLFELVFAN
ncbi:MAG: DNA-directed polymerase subunit beta [Paenibacillus sp.]|jgi:hypothetical protein|nr:DNA-directed polymerase subunit beta [Paenibacillus sp.]